MKITILYSTGSGVDYHRLLLPAKYLDKCGEVEIKLVEHKDCLVDESIFDCDILFYSTIFYYDFNLLQRLRDKYGFSIVLDLDDYPEPYKGQLHYNIWQKYGFKKVIFKGLKIADLVIVTNEQLLQVYEPFTKDIIIVPNALPFDVEPFIYNREDSGDIRFTYLVGNNHEFDFYTLGNLMSTLAKDKDFQDSGSLTLCGYNKPKDIKNVYDRMEDVANVCGKYIRRELLPLDNYITHYNYGDIAIAPLVNNIYNACRSTLKFIEAAAMRMPLICNNMLPYSIDKECTGIVFCNNKEDWYKAFQFFLKNPEKIKEFGEANYKYAKQHYNLFEINNLRYRAMSNLVTLNKFIPKTQIIKSKYTHR